MTSVLKSGEPKPEVYVVDMLDELPVGKLSLHNAPEKVRRRLFESFRLQLYI
jgi:hypothetical protein